MRKMSLLTTLFGIFFIQTAVAQTYKHKLANSPNNTVEFVLSGSPIAIKGYNGNQVIIKNTDYQAPPARAKGLHAIGGNGPDNTSIGLSVSNKNGVLKVAQTARGGDFTIKVPNKVHLKIPDKSPWNDDIHISNYDGEIEVSTLSADISLQNVTGPVVAHSTSGNINVNFSHLSKATPSSISVISGHIDVTLPMQAKTDLKLSTISGEIYTDFDIKAKNKASGLRLLAGGNEVKTELNGGGVELKLKTISGNIYLRKEK